MHRDIQADYVIRTDPARNEDDRETQDNMKLRFPGPHVSAGVRTYIVASAAAICILAVGLLLAVAWLIGAHDQLNGQAAQIRGLNQANARMSTQLSEVTGQLTGISARLAASDPASDKSLITCADLAHMGLTITTGGSVSSVPGNVSLSTATVRIPAHCSAKR